MTITKPQNLGVVRGNKTVFAHSSAILLNIDDKKVSVTFVCKSRVKLWSGFGAMLIGIAVGIMVVAIIVVAVAATVATGGVAGVILAGLASSIGGATFVIAGATAVAGAISIGVGLYPQPHECDCTLEAGSEWFSPHEKVTFNKRKAILQKSYLKCVKGGLIQPFIDSGIAHKAAAKFSSNNNAELVEHQNQQLITGFIGGFSGLGDPYGSGLGLALSSYEYFEGNDVKTLATENSSLSSDYQSNKDNAIRDNALGTGVGGVTGTVGVATEITKQNKAIIAEVMSQGGTYDQALSMTAFGPKTWRGEFGKMGMGMGVGLGFGIAGSVASHYISKSYKENKVALIRDIEVSRWSMSFNDSKNNIGILSQQ